MLGRGDVDLDIDWGNEHGLCEVVLQGEFEVSDLEFLGELKGYVGVILAWKTGVGYKASRICSIVGIGTVNSSAKASYHASVPNSGIRGLRAHRHACNRPGPERTASKS